jgi:hypothetical protein
MFDFSILSKAKNDFIAMLNSPIGTACTINNVTPVQAIFEPIKDNKRNVWFSANAIVKKGDLLSDNKYYYLVAETLFDFPYALKSSVWICNGLLTFQRYHDVVLDDYGNVIQEAGYSDVAANVKCYIQRNGTYQFDSVSGGIGIIPNNQILIGMQYLPGVAIGDVFDWYGAYKVVDIDYSNLNPDGVSGLLVIFAEKTVV